MSEHSDDEEQVIAEQNQSPIHSPSATPSPVPEEEEEEDLVQKALHRTTHRAGPARRGEIDLGDEEEEEIVDEMI